MGSTLSSRLSEPEIEDLSTETGFSKKQILRLYNRFIILDKSGHGFLSPEDFHKIPELEINPIRDRIINLFFKENDKFINFRQFLRTLSVFRPVNGHEGCDRVAKLKFAYSIYDIEENGVITMNDILQVLRMMVGQNMSEEQLMSIATRTTLESDYDKDGVITFEEFTNAMANLDVEKKMSVRFVD